jgi:translation initiation factor 3 subunit E
MTTEMTKKRVEVVSQLKELKAECKALLAVIEDPSLEKVRPQKGDKTEKSEKAFRDALVALVEANKITPEQVEALYKYAKLHFECGNYGQVQAGGQMGAAEFLPVYRMLVKDSTTDNSLSALWGKLAAEILLEKWDDAIDDLKKLRDIIDTRVRPLIIF